MFVAPFDARLVRQNPVSDELITTVVQPDICVICDPSKVDEKGGVGVPDMIVEVLSPGSATRDLKIKFDIYQEFGVKEYWIVSLASRT
jgi:Uma2 family endonuclease